jgi:hypothetical protein
VTHHHDGGAARLHDLLDGVLAGVVGSEALNVTSYLDMVVRARPASSTPQETARRFAEVVHLDLGSEARAANRRAGLGPLLGYATGAAVPIVLALAGARRLPLPVAAGLLGAGAMLASNGAMAALRVSDPRSWSRADWLSDVIPHLAYGFAAAATLRRLGWLRR